MGDTRKQREALALPAGTVLRCGGVRWTLGGAVCQGGSCLFYRAAREDSALPFGIKECCPSELSGRLIRRDGVLTGVDGAADAALAQARARMAAEAEISQRVAAVSQRALPVLEAPGAAAVDVGRGERAAPAGSFLLLRQVSQGGLFLPQLLEACSGAGQEGRLGLPVIVRILEQTLRALELVHRAGYLHGDIQPENLFFADARPEKGDVGFGCLLDFGGARPLLEGGETAPIADRLAFTTPGYTPPELALYNDGTLRLTPAADLYSVGRLLLYLVKGRTFWEQGRDRMLSEWWELSRLFPADGERLGCSSAALGLVQRLLDGALEPEPEQRRYQTAQAMLSDVEKLLELTVPAPNRLALSPAALGAGRFLGREEQLARLRQALEAGEKPVVLWGFAGMGKTELAVELCRRWRRGRTYFVSAKDSVRHTVTGPIAGAFSGYTRTGWDGREKPEEQVYREVMKLLAQRDEGDLLVLDSLDGEGGFDRFQREPAFRELCALPMGLVVTTRSPVEGGIEVDALPRPLLRELLGRFAALPDGAAGSLIDAVEGHTLTVELMGRTLKQSVPRLSPEELLDKLRGEELDSQALAPVSSSKDRAGRMARIQGHLTALFRLSQLPQEEGRLLAYALPIPPEGMREEDFTQVPGFRQETLLRLIDRGWVRRSGDGVLTLHPLVQETGWKELKVDLSDLIRFAQGSAVLPVLFRVREMTDQDLARAAGYLRGLFRHAVRPADKTYAGAQTFQVLAAWGRYRQAQETALELLGWLEACPRRDEYPICMRTALSLCREGAEWLEDFDRAEEYGFRAEQLEVPDGRLTEEDESYAPPSPPPLLAQQIERTAALEQAIAQGQTERAASWYEDSRRWFCQNGQNPARLDLMMGRLYEALGDWEQAYETLRRACEGMARWARPSEEQAAARFLLAKACAARGQLEEGRVWMGQAAAALGSLSAEARERLLSSGGMGMEPVEFAAEYGWKEEAESWRAAVDAWEQAQLARMRKELEEPDPMAPSRWRPPSGDAHAFLKEQGLGFDFDALPDLMADLAREAGLDGEAEAWRETADSQRSRPEAKGPGQTLRQLFSKLFHL